MSWRITKTALGFQHFSHPTDMIVARNSYVVGTTLLPKSMTKECIILDAYWTWRTTWSRFSSLFTRQIQNCKAESQTHKQIIGGKSVRIFSKIGTLKIKWTFGISFSPVKSQVLIVFWRILKTASDFNTTCGRGQWRCGPHDTSTLTGTKRLLEASLLAWGHIFTFLHKFSKK